MFCRQDVSYFLFLPQNVLYLIVSQSSVLYLNGEAIWKMWSFTCDQGRRYHLTHKLLMVRYVICYPEYHSPGVLQISYIFVTLFCDCGNKTWYFTYCFLNFTSWNALSALGSFFCCCFVLFSSFHYLSQTFHEMFYFWMLSWLKKTKFQQHYLMNKLLILK